MKIIRFEYEGQTNYGVLTEKAEVNLIKGDIYGEYEITNKNISCKAIKLLAPCLPSKAVCIGLNYQDHAREMKLELPNYPMMFLKPPSAVNCSDGEIEYPTLSNNLHYEAELAVVIKKKAKNIHAEQATNFILGYTCANDVTARDIQHVDGQWTRAKSFDTFLPLGPCIATSVNPDNLAIELYLNGQKKQGSNTSNLIFKVPQLIAFISQVMTLYPGDVVLTGTPAGVGPMNVGDLVVVKIEGIGSLTNTVVKR